MLIRVFGIESPIEMRQGIVSVIEIENNKLFRDLVFNLFRLSEGLDSKISICIEENNNLELLNNFQLITDIFNLNYASLQTKLNKFVLAELQNSEYNKLLFNNMVELKKIFSNFLLDLPLNLCYNDLELNDIVKDFNFKLDCGNDENFFQNLCNYLKALKILNVSDFIVFVDIKRFLSKSELEKLFDLIAMLDFRALLVESKISSEILSNEWKLSIDDDLYESIPIKL